MAPGKKPSLFPLVFTVFIDQMGMGIVIPIAAPLLMMPSAGMLHLHAALPARSIVLGFLLGSFSIAQFFGAPILGTLSDRYGRKKLFLLSIAGTAVGYLLFALGIEEKSLWLCFASRLLDGFTGGNISIAMSSIADISAPSDRAKNFGLIGMTFGLGFILGPFIGGKLADPSLVSWFGLSTPYWFAACLSVVNLLLILGFFRETLTQRSSAKSSLGMGIRQLKEAFTNPVRRQVFGVMFLIVFGFNFFTQFFQVFLIHRFAYTPSDIADLFAYIGLWLAFTQGLVNRPLSKFCSPRALVSFSALLCAIAYPFLLVPTKSSGIYLVVPFIALFTGINTPNLAAVISVLGGAKEQGSLLGMRQSVQAMSMALPPIFAGFMTAISVSLPIWAAAAFTLAGWLVFDLTHRQKKPEIS